MGDTSILFGTHTCMHAHASACVHACMRACVHACVCVHAPSLSRSLAEFFVQSIFMYST